MPHVQIIGETDLASFHRRFKPRAVRDGETILKAEACYISDDGRGLLVECTVVEGYLRQGFFALIAQRGNKTTSRLHPRTSPEKTDGVKRCVVWLGQWLRSLTPDAKIGTTNLAEELSRPFPEDAFPQTP